MQKAKSHWNNCGTERISLYRRACLQHTQLHHSEWSVFVRVVPLLECNIRAMVSSYSREQEWGCILRSSFKHPEIPGQQRLEYSNESQNGLEGTFKSLVQAPNTIQRIYLEQSERPTVSDWTASSQNNRNELHGLQQPNRWKITLHTHQAVSLEYVSGQSTELFHATSPEELQKDYLPVTIIQYTLHVYSQWAHFYTSTVSWNNFPE